MFVDPEMGRKWRDAKVWRQFKRQSEKVYVPSVEEDLKAFSKPTLGVGRTKERAAHKAADVKYHRRPKAPYLKVWSGK
jgi:hypothetical protein